ncbi:ferredoxin, partial [Streptomyces sp. NPDC005245]
MHGRTSGRPAPEGQNSSGDGICVQYAPEVFELDIDGLANVKSSEDELL